MREDHSVANNNPRRILVVEDSTTQAMELQDMLERNGYNVLALKNGVEALAEIDAYKPVIVISDIIMPEMDGYQLCEQIKKSESLKHVYVMLLTSLSKPQEVVQSLRCGADRFFTKPYDEDLLLSTIRSLLANDRQPDVDERKQCVNFVHGDKQYSLAASPAQTINLLISTYDAAVKKNYELTKVQSELELLNNRLEMKVRERTAALEAKNEELNMMSQQLWQATKLATLGELAASIAHELNNPLATVNLRVESLLAQTPAGDPKRRALEVVEQEVDRMGSLVANLLQFSRRSQREISTLDVCKEIDSALELLYYHLRKRGISVAREFSQNVPHIHADRQQLRQLFINLFTNSSDAMLQKGTLTIRVYMREADRDEQRAGGRELSDEVRPALTNSEKEDHLVGPQGEAESAKGQRAWIDFIMVPEARPPEPADKTFLAVEITDTGIGIPPEVMPKIAEPFFTTKPEGKGTGLGLPICLRIVREHNGLFTMKSEAGKGTSVYILFPVADRSGFGKGIGIKKQGDGKNE
jgi:signal transduction histidine kinase/CheY-like chemotaxis protein